ncbi:MAG TPA: DUF397 domain-containing protein, partial [Streptomyces sp.]
SYSNNQEGGAQCCEVARLPAGVRIRDSKLRAGAMLSFSFPAWQAAVAYWGEGTAAGGAHEQM